VGLLPMIVYWLYTAIVRPILLYEKIVWRPSLKRIVTSGSFTRSKEAQNSASVGH